MPRALKLPYPRRTLAVLTALVALADAARSHAATDPALKCQSGKNAAAGKYAVCRQKAEAKKAFAPSDIDGYNAAVVKCETKYNAVWPKLEQKAVDAGSVCPSAGDQVLVKAVIDAHVTSVAAELGGGPPPTCSFPLATCMANLATCEAAQQGELLKTGQTDCYDNAGAVVSCAGTGQDGEFQAGLARTYVDNGDGTISDLRTGLMWEKLSDDGSIHDVHDTYSWANAFSTKIANLNSMTFAGYSDWRLPNRTELESLVNSGAAMPAVISPDFNSACGPDCTVTTCSCTQYGGYWSSTTYTLSTSTALGVYFDTGGGVFAGSKTGFTFYYVRAVRSGG